ncbi:MAG: hypothetical protein IPK82_33000 [Polyangiaceae bacterium]|nr:hypothetical protein [Polyangiaceae bacterium]
MATPEVIWFGPVNGFQVKGATLPGVTPRFVTCTGDGSDGGPTCADRAEAWRDATGRRLPTLFKRLKINPADVSQLTLGAFSAGGQIIKRLGLDALDRAQIHAVLLSDATYTIEWLNQKQGTTKPIEGFLKLALDYINDGRLFLATASAAPNKAYPSGAQSLLGLKTGIEQASGLTFDPAEDDPLWADLKPPVRAFRLKNVIFADFGMSYKHGEHATLLAPILWPRALGG